jgi:hypothetical protein
MKIPKLTIFFLKSEPKLKKPKMQTMVTSPIKAVVKQQPPQLQQQIQFTKPVAPAKTATFALPIKSQQQPQQQLQQQQPQQQLQQIKSTPIQIQDIKFLPSGNKCMVPIVLKNSGDATQQIFSQFTTTPDSSKPVAYLQMKVSFFL